MGPIKVTDTSAFIEKLCLCTSSAQSIYKMLSIRYGTCLKAELKPESTATSIIKAHTGDKGFRKMQEFIIKHT